MEEIFVKKEKILEMKHVRTLENHRVLFKKIEHGKVKKLTGAEMDKLIKDTEDYLKRIKRLFKQIERKKEKGNFMEVYNSCVKIVKDILSGSGIKSKSLTVAFKKYCEKNNLPDRLVITLREIIKAKRDLQEKRLVKAEADKLRREARIFIRILVEHLQRKRSLELQRVTIRFKHGGQFGEIILLGNAAFITTDIEAKEKEIQKADIKSDGSLGTVKKSSLEELEKYLNKTKIPANVFIKEKIFEDLRNLFGKDIEILVNY
jgi:hypothetical protein